MADARDWTLVRDTTSRATRDTWWSEVKAGRARLSDQERAFLDRIQAKLDQGEEPTWREYALLEGLADRLKR